MDPVTDTTPDPTPDPVPDAPEGEQPPAAEVETVTLPAAELQARIDAAVQSRLARERRKFEEEQQQAAERAKMDETQRLAAEKADAEKAAAEAQAAADARIIRTEAKVAAIAAGVPAERIDAFLRVVDLAEVTVVDGDPEAEALKTAIEAALTAVPEFKGAPPAAPSGGDFGGTGAPKVWTRADISKLSPAEYEKHEAEILAQLSGAGIK